MDVTFEALYIFVLLLPGFLSSIILNMLIVRKPQDNLARLIEALVLSFLTYGLVAGVFRIHFLSAASPATAGLSSSAGQVNPNFLGTTLLVAVVLPLFLAFLSTNDLHMRALRALRVSAITARATTWLDVFMSQKRYVIVNLTDGRRIFGWPMYYSNEPKEGLLYLYDPAWVQENGEYLTLDIHGLFLVEKGLIESIEFTGVTEDNAVPKHIGPSGEGRDRTYEREESDQNAAPVDTEVS